MSRRIRGSTSHWIQPSCPRCSSSTRTSFTRMYSCTSDHETATGFSRAGGEDTTLSLKAPAKAFGVVLVHSGFSLVALSDASQDGSRPRPAVLECSGVSVVLRNERLFLLTAVFQTARCH